MQHVMQFSKLRSMIIGFSSILTATLLFSCSKNVADVDGPAVEEATAANGSPNSANENTIHAVPFETTLYVPCANGGAGEDVVLTGFTNFIYQASMNDQGFIMIYHDNVYQVTGIGVSSNENFHASGGTNGTVRASWENSQWNGITTRKMRVFGPNTSFTVTYKYHLTVKSDGTVIVNNIEQATDCN